LRFSNNEDECPLWVKSEHDQPLRIMSAFGGKADIVSWVSECLLLAKSGHAAIANVLKFNAAATLAQLIESVLCLDHTLVSR